MAILPSSTSWRLIKPYGFLISSAAITLIIFTNLGLLLPWAMKIVLDRALPASDFKLLGVILVSLIVIYALRAMLQYVSFYLTHFVAQRILFDLRRMLFAHLQRLSIGFFETFRTGKLISNVITDVNQLQNMLSQTLINLVVNLFMVVSIFVFLLILNAPLTLICCVVIPLHFANFVFFQHLIRRRNRHRQELLSEISGNLSETLNGIRIVKSFGTEKWEERQFVREIRQLLNMNMQISMNGVACSLISQAFVNVGILTALVVGGVFVIRGALTVGEFVAFYAYLGMLFNPVTQLSNMSPVIAQGRAAMQRIDRILQTVPEISERQPAIELSQTAGRITFEDISFGYNGNLVVEGFNLTVEPGETVALVGPSGSGKSTLAQLLLRFYDPNEGRICLDGHDIRDLKLGPFKRQLGVVTQEPFLFSGSIRDNISYAKRDASEKEIQLAAQRANAHAFISELPDGYDTEIGENGTRLSGGQKQRIAIARALLKDPAILILDEATSALDTLSERIVQQALDRLMAERTTVVIAHRLSTVRNADKIVVMQDGHIVQQGRHEALLAQPGLYRHLYELDEDTGADTEDSEHHEVPSRPVVTTDALFHAMI